MSRNTSPFPIKLSAAASPVGSGACGIAWKLTIAAGKSVAVKAGVGPTRLVTFTGAIGGGSSGQGDSLQRQNRLSSIFSHELQAPITASAKTPFVGVLNNRGGSGVIGAYRSNRSGAGLSGLACSLIARYRGSS